ncbi:DNA fragmentation factor subunit beta-like [Penaeus japonicus]|uniref:DNA fragmentation factor subunit beta-like n=1 Tax=Penaeus japonicus TaxID=27405 RepID=UPI001C7170DF|nr:DNA fragmentation factor subunit beta-like [Penaeus japonicus]
MEKKKNLVAIGPQGKRFGLVARSFEQFVQKSCEKFGFQNDETLKVALPDDTEIDEEYFEFVSPGSELLVSSSSSDETPKEIEALASFLHKCVQKQPRIHDRIMGVLRESSQSPKVAELLGLLAMSSHGSASVSERGCDHEWFKGLDTRFKTKESVLRNSAETRMRGYFEQAKKDLLADGPRATGSARRAIEFFRQQLKSCGYNAAYFDRSACKRLRLCNSDGLFECEGQYDAPRCPSTHVINPYACREARIVFSTWNLDHVVEKSRSVLPALREALAGPRAESVNLPYFHSLLFQHRGGGEGAEGAEGNLKLVHIACHVKKPHEARCNPRDVYLRAKGPAGKANARDAVDGRRRAARRQSGPCGTAAAAAATPLGHPRRRKRTSVDVCSVRRSKRPRVVRGEGKAGGRNPLKHLHEGRLNGLQCADTGGAE